jgi:hypothetical protein
MYKYLSIYLGRYFSQQLRVKLEWDAGNYGSWVRSVNFGRNGGGGLVLVEVAEEAIWCCWGV